MAPNLTLAPPRRLGVHLNCVDPGGAASDAPPTRSHPGCGTGVARASPDWRDASLVDHGYVKDGDSYTFFTVPDAAELTFLGTSPSDISNSGVIVGYYYDSSSRSHGFIMDGTTGSSSSLV